MNDRKNSAIRLGFMTPLLLCTLFFVLCCGVISCVLIRSAAVSREAEIYNAAVTICRSEAERFRAGASDEEDVRYFNDSFIRCVPEDSAYTLRIECSESATAAGHLETATLSAGATGEEPVYSLTVTAYRRSEG